MTSASPAIDDRGWLESAEKIPSPNYDARPENERVRLIVVHCISLPPGEYGGAYIRDFFQNRLDPGVHEYFAGIHEMQVSAHCLIERDGHIVQFVSFNDRAWHAGQSCWREESACNDFSIGIELEGCDEDSYTEAQYQALGSLVRLLRSVYPSIESDAIAGHSDIAPGRKTDPGPGFHWETLKALV